MGKMLDRQGFGIFFTVVGVAIITGLIISILLMVTIGHYKAVKDREFYYTAKYAYEAGLKRGEWELMYNPLIYNDTATPKPYNVDTMVVGDFKVTVQIDNDNDGDGEYDIVVSLDKN